MASKNVTVFNYLDDVIYVHLRCDANAEFDILYSLFEFLGIPINPKKIVSPTTKLPCMGIEVDVDARCITIPQENLVQVLDLCSAYVHKNGYLKSNFKVS